MCDANVLLSAILGRARRPERLIRARAQLMMADVQLAEVVTVLTRLGEPVDAARQLVARAASGIVILDVEELRVGEEAARSRLHDRGQPDWPVVAGAIELDAAIWSDDRDFFGVGVPVWSTWTLDRHPILTGRHDA